MRVRRPEPTYLMRGDDPVEIKPRSNASTWLGRAYTVVFACYVATILFLLAVTGNMEVNFGFFEMFLTSPPVRLLFTMTRIITFTWVAILAIIAWLKYKGDWRASTARQLFDIVRNASFLVIMLAVIIVDATAMQDPAIPWVFRFSRGSFVVEIPAWIDFTVTFSATIIIFIDFVVQLSDARHWHDIESAIHAESGVGKSVITANNKRFSCVDMPNGRVCRIDK